MADERTINQEAGLPDNWHPIDTPPIRPGRSNGGAPPSPNPMLSYFEGSIGSDLQHDARLVATEVATPRIDKFPLMPIAPSGNPQNNAAIQSIINENKSTSTVTSSGMNFRGFWNSFTAYKINDVVLDNNSAYVAILGNIGQEPDQGHTNGATDGISNINPAWSLLGKNLNFRGLWAQPSGIQTAHSQTADGITTSVGLTVQKGSLILITTFVENVGATTVPSLSDNQGNVYTLVVQSSRVNMSQYQAQTWQTVTSAAGSLLTTVVWTGGTSPGFDDICMTEIPATVTSGVNAPVAAAQGTTSGGAYPSISVGASFSGELLYTAAFGDNGISALTGYSSVVFSLGTVRVSWTVNTLSSGNTIKYGPGFSSGGSSFLATAVSLLPGSSNSYNPYDVVEYNGSLWLCIIATNTAPSYVNANWVIFAPATGFASLLSVNHLATLDDEGKLLSFNSSSALTLTLPAIPPDSGWWITVENTGTGTLTISPNGLSIDGLASLILTTNQGVAIFTDGFNYYTFRGAAPSIGGVAIETVNYAALLSDSGKLLSFNGSNLTLTLPNPSPSAKWVIFVQNLNSTNLTINPNGLNIDGSASNLTLGQNQGITIFTDGTNYFTLHGVNNLTVPNILTVTAPDGSGSVAIDLATQSAKTFLGGPVACSSAAKPTFRQPQGTDFINLNIASASGSNQSTTQSGTLQLCSSTLSAGLYRVSIYMVVSTTGAGNLALTLTWNDGVSSQTVTPASISTTVRGTVAQFSIVVLADGVHDISYAFTLS